MRTSLAPSEFSLLQINPLYARLSPGVRQQIEARGRLRRFGAGQQVFVKGDPGDGVYVVLSGELEYNAISPSGKQSIVNVVTQGKWMGDTARNLAAMPGRRPRSGECARSFPLQEARRWIAEKKDDANSIGGSSLLSNLSADARRSCQIACRSVEISPATSMRRISSRSCSAMAGLIVVTPR